MSGGGTKPSSFLTSGISGLAGRGFRARTCASERRARFLLGRTRKGFTLVEVIVVLVILVILAILAAIAIPALTGYIDKAKLKELESEVRAQMIAVQTMLSERYAEYGDFENHIAELKAEFGDAYLFKDAADIPVGIAITCSSSQFFDEYERLTGDTHSFRDRWGEDCYVRTDFSGAIVCFQYSDYDYYPPQREYPRLRVMYFKDIDSPIAEAYLLAYNFSTLQAAKEGRTNRPPGVYVVLARCRQPWQKGLSHPFEHSPFIAAYTVVNFYISRKYGKSHQFPRD
jgi:prepilin-type N-terminal cleavage/methylation domain-containing protein